jgi:hypothetical protein
MRPLEHDYQPQPVTPERLKEIATALAAIPPAPWCWHRSNLLATDYWGRHALMAATPTGELAFRPFRHDGMPRKLRTVREITVDGIENPLADWIKNSPAYVADLLAELRKLTAPPDTNAEHRVTVTILASNDEALAAVEHRHTVTYFTGPDSAIAYRVEHPEPCNRMLYGELCAFDLYIETTKPSACEQWPKQPGVYTARYVAHVTEPEHGNTAHVDERIEWAPLEPTDG